MLFGHSLCSPFDWLGYEAIDCLHLVTFDHIAQNPGLKKALWHNGAS